MAPRAVDPTPPDDVGHRIRWDRLEPRLGELRAAYATARPFRHVVLDDFLDVEACRRLLPEYRDVGGPDWIENRHVCMKLHSRTGLASFGPELRGLLDELDTPRFRAFLSAIHGMDGLFLDKELEDGGVAAMARGDFFDLHTDMLVHPLKRRWTRQVNFILYLSDDWDEAWKGSLELWNASTQRCEARVVPRFNRVVVFEVGDHALHGVPDHLACPPGALRRSLALYYFTESAHPKSPGHFRYRARPGETLRRPLVFADNAALWLYHFARMHLGLTDQRYTRWIRAFRRKTSEAAEGEDEP